MHDKTKPNNYTDPNNVNVAERWKERYTFLPWEACSKKLLQESAEAILLLKQEEIAKPLPPSLTK